jgi:hypothetical protein
LATRSSVATEITTKTRIKVMSASTMNPCRIPTPGASPGEASAACEQASAPTVSQVAIAPSIAPISCATT